MTTDAGEIERIRAEYMRRDAGAASEVYSMANPAYQFHLQRLEWDLLRALRDLGEDLRGRSVLEVGCGFGQILHRFLEFGAREAAGIDLMENRVEEAHRRYPMLQLTAGDASALPYDDASFDLVTQFTCLSSVLDADVRARIAAEMWRVTRPGGLVLSYDMTPTPGPIRALGWAWRRAAGARGDAAVAATTPTVPLGEDDLRALFPAAPALARRVTLNFDLAGVARRSRAAASLLAAVPALRTHLLAVLRRPGP